MILATWPAIPMPPGYQPRYSLHDGAELPVVVWPAVPPSEPVALKVERRCIDCDALLPEYTRRGRKPVRCADCAAGPTVPDWQRPYFMPAGLEGDMPWLTEELKPAPMAWEQDDAA
jgi:hypothetical protein